MREVRKAVKNINEKFFYDYPLKYDIRLHYFTDGIIEKISYLGMTIWDYTNDERDFDEEAQDFEDLEGYLVKQMNIIHKKVNSVRFIIKGD